ncbi:DUF58 domain-containing protein [Nocardioides lijunqiniae]|uniref:DUF58 domain-containing protein n=1 Tax=Nocardioides lijunqiniae TaxID=2760832 RepID=UPI001877570E|nr:DUF58 domain-containing protein [Nocardioides lijunqiniae]
MTTHLPRIKARLAIHSHRKVRGLLQGEYASTAVGRSMDLNDLREYVRGDDVRDIDWKASARGGQMLVKRFVATRKHTVLVVVSTGRSMAAVNEQLLPKRDLAVFVAGVVGWLAVRHGDLVGVAYGDAAACHVRPASGGELRLERSLGAVHDAITPHAAPADLAGLLEHVARVVRRRRTIMVVVCDEHGLDERTVAALGRARVQHEVLLVTLDDLDPTRRPVPGLTDVDQGAPLPDWLGGDARLRQDFVEAVATEAAGLKAQLARLGIPHERVADHETAVPAVFRLLERHRHARGR